MLSYRGDRKICPGAVGEHPCPSPLDVQRLVEKVSGGARSTTTLWASRHRHLRLRLHPASAGRGSFGVDAFLVPSGARDGEGGEVLRWGRAPDGMIRGWIQLRLVQIRGVLSPAWGGGDM